MARRSLFKAIKNGLIFGGLVAAFAVGRRLPLRIARGLGRAVGRLAWHVVPDERRKAIESVATAFPEKSGEERREIVFRAFEHLGESLFEIFWLPNLTIGNFRELTRFEGEEHVRQAVALKRGLVFFTGHCGNWEWLGSCLALSGLEVNVIAREIYDPRINDFIVASRARKGVRTIGRGSASAAKEILQSLKRGAILGVLIDQNIDAESAPIDFFGLPAQTPIGPARLAIRAGAVVLSCFSERRDGMQVLRFNPPIETTRDMDAVELSTRMTRDIEEQIRRVPAQWVWMHQRWRERKPKS